MVYSSTVLHGTRVYQTWVPHNFFLIAQIQLNSAMVAELMKNSSFWNSNSRKKWYFAIYFQNSIFLLKFFKNYGIWPFWPKNATIISSFPTQNKMTSGPIFFFFFFFPSLSHIHSPHGDAALVRKRSRTCHHDFFDFISLMIKMMTTLRYHIPLSLSLCSIQGWLYGIS